MSSFKITRPRTLIEKLNYFETYTNETVQALKEIFPNIRILSNTQLDDYIEIAQPIYPVAKRFAILNEVEVIEVDFTNELYGVQEREVEERIGCDFTFKWEEDIDE